MSDARRFLALFETEDFNADGERVGPIDVFDLAEGKKVDQLEDWVTESQARTLAKERGWGFRVDNAPDEF